MNLSIGIVGLPNVGKSTLFNALLKKQQALVANYPFATIEPNIGVVAVPDDRLLQLAEITQTEHKMSSLPPIKPAVINFVDIAGLVKGASEGAGLGNKFLSHIREVSVVAHVIRVFKDSDVIRYQDEKEARLPASERSDGGQGNIDVKSDYETINTELLLADLESARNQESRIKSNDTLKPLLVRIVESLSKGIPVRDMEFKGEDKEIVKKLFFLSSKPEIIVLNVSEADYNPSTIAKITKEYSSLLGLPEHEVIVICAKIEAELASLSELEQIEYLKELGIGKSGLERLIQKAYEELGLISFLTCGEKEVKAWTIKKGSNAVEAAGEIHTDFMKKFIKAEVVHYQDFIENNGPARNASSSSASVAGGWKAAREHGKALLEGRDYIMQDGDVVEFKIGS